MKQCPVCQTTYPDEQRFCGQDGNPLAEFTPIDPLIGHVIAGTYQLRKKLGAGGFGTVYLATHERLPMQVAVKLLNALRTLDAGMVSRFRLEVEAEALLTHPNIVRVLDHGQDPKAGFFIVMEHLNGRDLAKLLDAKQQLGILEIFALVDQTASALDAAHKAGIVHRDVKAENLFLVEDRTRTEGFFLKLLDFGLARLTRNAVTPHGQQLRAIAHRSSASRTFGSPATMAPEVATAGNIDHRADIYSLGAVIFELLTGHILFEAKTLDEMLHRIVHLPPVAPSSTVGGQWVPPELDEVVLSMLAKNPAKRPQTMAEVRRRFERARPVAEDAWANWFLPGGTAGPVQQRRRVAAQIPGSMPTIQRDRPLVLSVDDDRAMRGLVQTLVHAAGCDCEALDGGEAALDWLRRHPPPDAIICDVLMPGMDGLTLVDTARANGFNGPVVFCSSVVSSRLRGAAADMGNTWCLDKAMELHKIPETLRAAGLVPLVEA
jgi:serine/threonine protein kinase